MQQEGNVYEQWIQQLRLLTFVACFVDFLGPFLNGDGFY